MNILNQVSHPPLAVASLVVDAEVHSPNSGSDDARSWAVGRRGIGRPAVYRHQQGYD